MAEVKGDLRVRRTLVADNRADQGMSSEALSATRTVVRHDYKYLNLDPNGANRNVDLPDATTLPLGWEIFIRHSGSANSLVVRNGAASPSTIKTITVPAPTQESRFYQFLLIDNATDGGQWQIVELNDPSRNVVTFVTGDWPAPVSGKSTLTGAQVSGLYATNHGKGAFPLVEIQEDVGGGYFETVILDAIRISTSGDIELVVSQNATFSGRVIIQ